MILSRCVLTNLFSKVVVHWTGNTERISQAHYQKATEEHFQRAAENDTELTANRTAPQSGSRSEKMAKNPAQSTSEMVCQRREMRSTSA
jgi:hypothetical protein